jgi:hypothetical protein
VAIKIVASFLKRISGRIFEDVLIIFSTDRQPKTFKPSSLILLI